MAAERAEPYVGIDVSKRQLDISVGQDGEYWTVANDAAGIQSTMERLVPLAPALIVVESTGGLESALVAVLYDAGLPIVVAHPGRVREFAKSVGLLAKTDKLDARVLARYAEAVRPAPTELPNEAQQYLSSLMTRRGQVIEMLVAEKNRLLTARLSVRERLRKHIDWLEAELAQLNCIIRAMPTIDSDGCRPPIPGHADHQFRRMAPSFSWTPESVVALLRNQWAACSGILRSTSDPIRSGAG